MISLYMDCTCINTYWIPNLDRHLQTDIGWKINAEVMVSTGALLLKDGKVNPDKLRAAQTAMRGLRERGIKCVPCCILLAAISGHSWETWYDEEAWKQIAEGVRELAECRVYNDLRVALNFEPKDTEDKVFDPPEEFEDDGLYLARLTIAMRPLVQVIKEEEITPMVLPGALSHAPSALICSQVRRTIMLDPGTYFCPLEDDPRRWEYYGKSKLAIETLARQHLPGFYAKAMRSQWFQKTLEDKGIHDYWCFFRRKGHRTGGHDDAELFWLPEWFTIGNEPPVSP